MKRKKNIKLPKKAEDSSLKIGFKNLKIGKEKISIDDLDLLKKEIYKGNLETYLYLIERYLEDADSNRDKSFLGIYEIFLERL